MKVFLDSSVVLRKVLGEANPLVEWSRITHAAASRLLAVEVARVVDRLRMEGQIDDDDVAHVVQQTRNFYQVIDEIKVNEAILRRASGAFPTVVGSLDAIHLASALTWAEDGHQDLRFATHDRQLGRAARACGLDVVGLE